ncbi:DENN domain-containing protein 2A-like [Euwallacea similis]|uniref:DENN domain-containing protein 2A-like n=1 Tax=Euwallacea similis TaxID=1736056 RepID=UPI00344BFDF3
MYRPPQNCNRVKSIKNKFENIENQSQTPVTKAPPTKNNLRVERNLPLSERARLNQLTTTPKENPKESKVKPLAAHPTLVKQLSDPQKCNIKRTPAFRVDKHSEILLDKQEQFKRNDPLQRTLFETKVKQFNNVKSSDNKVERQCRDNEACSSKVPLSSDLNYTPEIIFCDSSSASILTYNSSFLHSHCAEDMSNKSVGCSINKTDLYDLKSFKKPLLIKSKSSHDFHSIRSKFSSSCCERMTENLPVSPRNVPTIEKHKEKPVIYGTDLDESAILKNINLSLLYTEPIPKSLRNKQPSESSSSNAESPLFKPKIKDIYTKSTLQLTDVDKKVFLETLKKALSQDLPGGWTDSLKVALKKPLPDGPAPKKPPRTFQHCGDQILNVYSKENPPFLNVTKEMDRKNVGKKNGRRNDPKYMLNKLEMALKNNKLKTRKQQKVDVSTTSGEDSDDSLLFRSKSSRNLPKPPSGFHTPKVETDKNSNGFSDFLLGDLNCFNNSFGCGNPAYQRIKEPNSSFFVERPKDPIYAEPIQNRNSGIGGDFGKSNRGSLYYMSTTLIQEDTGQSPQGSSFSALPIMDTKLDDLKEDRDSTSLNRQISAENSSLSSFTSDLDSNPSPVTDDPHAKIRYLIENFEQRRQTLPKIKKGAELTDSGQQDSCNRVEVLKNSLRQTLDRSFNTVVGSRNSDTEEGKVARMVARFHTFQKTAPKYQQPKINKDTLFYCCLVIEKVRDCAQIKFKFPPNVEIPRDIEQLCFPESPDSPPLEGTNAAQTYTLLVTNETGDRTYGYCRRVLPEGSTYCLPLAYCILSKYKAPQFYKKILLELECRHGIQDKFREQLISQFYLKKFPKPGQSISINLSFIEDQESGNGNLNELEESLDLSSYIHVNKTGEYGTLTNSRKTAIFVSENDILENCSSPSYVTYEGNTTELVLTLHPDPRYEDADLKKLHKLPSDILLKIFSSLLLERKVVLISSVISELSSCVDSLQSILYPFTWYHTFIPILPEALWDIVESPTPVVCGVLSEDAIEDRHIENGIVVNLDTQSVLVEEGDEMKILSSSLQKVWRQFISLANNNKTREYVYSVYLADAYLYVFISCFKNYKQYIVDRKFQKDDLIKAGKSKGIRRFLKMFTETCMFHAFMDTALNNSESLATFDKKIELYGSDESRVILDKLIEWHR